MKIIEVGQDLIVKIALDSFNAKKIDIDQSELVNQALVSGVWIFFLRDNMMFKFNKNNTFAMRFIIDTFGRGSIIAASRFIRKKETNFMKLFMEQAIFSGASLIGGNILTQLKYGAPVNGFMNKADIPQENEASQPVPPGPQFRGGFPMPGFF